MSLFKKVLAKYIKPSILVCDMLDEGDIAEHQLSVFYNAVREFFVCATGYLMKWCPLQDELLTHATWIGLEFLLWSSYIVGRYPNLFSGMDMDKLNEQYLSYQVLTTEEIPAYVWP